MAGQTSFPKRYLFYALAVAFLANFLNYLDRNVVSALEEQITSRLRISSTQFGFLWTAFTLGYMLSAPLIGYLADRVVRVRLFALCVLVWSAATLGCALAANAESFALFFVMRVLIGVGEAGCLIIGPILVSDYFPREIRGRALSMFFLAVPLGGTAGFLTAGFMAEHGLWVESFTVAGLPGFAVAAAVFFLREPARGASEGASADAHGALPTASFRSYVDLLKTRTLLYIILAQAFAVFTLVPMMHFGINYFEALPMLKKDATVILGGLALAGGIVGNFIGGFLGDRMRKRDPGAYAFLAMLGYLVGLPYTVIGLRIAPLPLSYVWIFVSFAMFFMCMPLVNTQIANVVHPGQRAVAYAAAVFILHILGDTLSPPLFGKVKDVSGDTFAFTLFPFSLLASAFFCFLAWRHARRDVEAVGRRIEADRSESSTTLKRGAPE